MKIIPLTFISITLCSSAFAQNYMDNRYDSNNQSSFTPQTFTDYAKIKSVKPEYAQVDDPRQICQDEIVREEISQGYQGRNYGGVAIGGIAGALVGNQIGRGNGRNAATALGAVTGALVGDNVANNNQYRGPQYQDRTIQRCSTINNSRSELMGYLVEYEYRGQIVTIRTQDKPVGNKLKLRIDVIPEI